MGQNNPQVMGVQVAYMVAQHLISRLLYTHLPPLQCATPAVCRSVLMGCMLSSCLGLPSQVQGGESNPLPQYMPPALKCSQPGALLYSLVMATGFRHVFVLPSTS